MEYPVQTPAHIGAVLRGYRDKKGLTQLQLGSLVGLSQRDVSFMENHPERLKLTHLFQFLSAAGLELVVREKQKKPRTAGSW